MIGTNIRSIRHLYRLVSDTSLNTALIKFAETNWDICKIIKTPKDSPFGENMFIFNHVSRQSHWGIDTLLACDYFKKRYDQKDVYPNYSRLISINPTEFKSFSTLFREIILLPTSYDKDYEKFLKENAKTITSLHNKIGININDVKIQRLYIYSDGSKNFFQWATKHYYENRVSLSTIKNIFLWNDSYKQLAKNLSKGTITGYTTRDSINKLILEMSKLRNEKRINDSINSFNTTQKKLLKENPLSEENKQALWRFSKLTDVKKINFIRKMSTVNDFNELTRQLRFVTSVHFTWNKESFMDFISNVEGIKYEKIFENDNVVLVKVLDYETIKQLGKTTNWCISKNKQYWNNYIENYKGATTQYMVFDFSKIEDDKLSIVGFTTTHNKGITSAHNFVNDNLMGGDNNNNNKLLKSFIAKFIERRSIYSILNDDGIDITLVAHYDAPLYKWDKENLMKYLYECVNKENVDILKDQDNKLVLSVTDDNIRYFFGDAYHDNIPSDYWALQHLMFINFNLSQYDINKVQFAIIDEGGGYEEYCIGIYNERALCDGNNNLDIKLMEYGLPYDTIKRINNPKVKLRNAIFSYNLPLMTDCIKEGGKKLIEDVITHDVGRDSLYDLVNQTVTSDMSFDYLDMLYNNGLQLSSFMPLDYVSDLLKNIAQHLRNAYKNSTKFNKLQKLTAKDVEEFYNETLPTRFDALCVGYYLALNKIIINETSFGKENSHALYKRLIDNITLLGVGGEFFDDILFLIWDKLDFNISHSNVTNIINYAVNFGGIEINERVEKLAEEFEYCKQLLTAAKKKKQKANVSNYTISLNDALTEAHGINVVDYAGIFGDNGHF